MSWSVRLIGHPASVAVALDAYGEKLSEPSKAEFLDAKPHLIGLLGQYVATPAYQPVIDLAANGHASFADGVKTAGYVGVTLQQLGGTLV